eukprot:Tamp_07936.p1 GENE.Tamp_07936~~Tamp_07936.p1  ORF type:complete len:508 (+),score=81.49 Tamp_07936:103-1626(+)
MPKQQSQGSSSGVLRRLIGTSSDGRQEQPKKNSLRKFKRADLEVSDKIGKGAYGGVWQATVLDTGQEVVVKVVWPDADLDPEDAKNESPGQHRKDAFKREIEMMRRVGSHPNVIGVLGATADSTVIVFEEALTDLHVIVKKQKRSLSLPIVRRCIRDILQGVEYLHQIRVVHRDLKPANILVFKDMTCKLGDFGLAREFNEPGEMTVKNEVSTLWYRAPELIMGSASYTPIIDEWSTGCILLELLTGRCPLMGRVEDVCDCPQPTHFNYNSDQLLKIFHLVGTPTESDMLAKMQCLKHFQGWPKHRSTLENLVRSMCTASRIKGPDKDKGQVSERDVEQNIQEINQVCHGLLQLWPSKRVNATAILQLPLFQAGKPPTESSTDKNQSPKFFSRVQSLPVASSDPQSGATSKQNSHTSPVRELTKPSKKLVLHPFKRTSLEQENTGIVTAAAGGGGVGLLSKDKVNTNSTLKMTLQQPTGAARRSPDAAFGALRRIPSAANESDGMPM